MSNVEAAKALLAIRNKLEAERSGPIDFYDAEIKKLWSPDDIEPEMATLNGHWCPRPTKIAQASYRNLIST